MSPTETTFCPLTFHAETETASLKHTGVYMYHQILIWTQTSNMNRLKA